MGRQVRPFNVSHGDIFRIALPASIAFITEPLVGIVDITVIGRLGDAGLLGGLELGAVTFSLVFSMAFFLRLGTAGLTAQSVGAQRGNDIIAHLLRASMLGIGLGLLLLVSSPLVQMLGLLLFAPPSMGVETAFLQYLQIRMWSAPFVLLNFVFLGWFYGRGRAKTGMALQIGLNSINIILSIWLVYGFGLGVAGVAWGTVVAEITITLMATGIVLKEFSGNHHLGSKKFVQKILHKKDLWRLFDLSRDLMIRSAALMSAFAFFSAQMSRSGEINLAASAVLLNFMMVTAFFLDGQAQAAEFYCGKAMGANYRPAFEKAWMLAALWGLAIGFVLFVVWLIAGPWLIDFITTNEEVRTGARQYLFVAALISFSGVIAFVMDGVMTGATMNSLIRNGMLVSFAIYIAVAFMFQEFFGLLGLWLALNVFFVVRGTIFWFAVRAKLDKLFTVSQPGIRTH